MQNSVSRNVCYQDPGLISFSNSYDLCRNGRCKNTRGSFTCECPDGYVLAPDGQHCEDVNECADPSFCPQPGTCQNVLGTAICTCPEGYQLNPAGNACQDINECREDPTFCTDGFCQNTQGSATCECPAGWELGKDGKGCVDVREEPCYNEYRSRFCLSPRSRNMTKQNCCCTMGQAWGNGCSRCPRQGTKSFKELCPLGPGRGGSGEDFNECAMIDDLCEGGTCINTDGAFR